VEVHAILEGRHAPVTRSRYLTGWDTVPPLSTDDEWVGALLGTAARIGRPAVLIPMDDAGAILTSERRKDLAEAFLLPDQPPDLPRRLSDKGELAAICQEAGVPHPPGVVVADPEEVPTAVAGLGLPLVAKWTRPWLLPSGAGLRSTTVVRTAVQAMRLAEASGQAGSPLLLQGFLAGGPDADWFFHGCFDARSRCLFGATGRKERSFPPGAGITTLGRWLRNDDIAETAAKLAEAVGFAGLLDLDLRRDPETGRFHLLDFNPRLGAQFRLFTDADGLDLVRALHLDLTGRAVPESEPGFGRTFFVENYDPATLRHLRRRQPDAAAEPAWYASDDLRPVAALGWSWARHVIRRLGRGRRREARAETEIGAAAVPTPVPVPEPEIGDARGTT
jgi:predicted ATP-grasp superfamily ATP-dependent carboligase